MPCFRSIGDAILDTRGNDMLRMTRKEVAKVTHDINNVWHAKYEGEEVCMIDTYSNRPNGSSYSYYFINHGFNDYSFFAKYPTKDGR